MSKFDGCEISRAVLAGHVFVNNVGQYGPTLSNIATATTKAVKMHLDGEFLVLELKDKFNKDVIELVPKTAVLHMTPVIKA